MNKYVKVTIVFEVEDVNDTDDILDEVETLLEDAELDVVSIYAEETT